MHSTIYHRRSSGLLSLSKGREFSHDSDPRRDQADGNNLKPAVRQDEVFGIRSMRAFRFTGCDYVIVLLYLALA